VQVAVARGSDYFGPGGLISSMGERVFYPLLTGKKVAVLGDPDALHTYTYLPDFGRALVALSENEDAPGKVWHVPSAETLTTRQFLDLAFAEAGLKPRIGTTPKLMLRMAGLFVPDIREAVEMVYQFERPFVLDGSRIEATFGLRVTPVREALRDTLRWFRDNPKG
jgi:nucleoside-diphosphate-sugar epimerase